MNKVRNDNTRNHIACSVAAVIAGLSYSYFMRLRNQGKGPPEFRTSDGKIAFIRKDVVAWKKLAPWRTCEQGQNVKRVAFSDMVRFDVKVSKAWLLEVQRMYGPNLTAKVRPILAERFPVDVPILKPGTAAAKELGL